MAASQAMAKAQLRKQGIAAKTVKKKAKPLFSFGQKKVKPADVAVFTRQMATMMKAGVPLVQSFDIVQEGLDNEAMRDLVGEIKNECQQGEDLRLHWPNIPSTSMTCFAAWSARGRTRARWMSCWTGWLPTRRKPKR